MVGFAAAHTDDAGVDAGRSAFAADVIAQLALCNAHHADIAARCC